MEQNNKKGNQTLFYSTLKNLRKSNINDFTRIIDENNKSGKTDGKSILWSYLKKKMMDIDSLIYYKDSDGVKESICKLL